MKKQPLSRLLLLGTVALLSFGFILPDDGALRTVVQQLEKWTATYPQEKVYLQLDKPYYAAGDSIWFKAYLTLGPQHELSGLSNILKVELVNEQDQVQNNLSLPVTDGTTWGDIPLPGNLPAGTYRLRAYTNWMRNFSDEYFYDEPLVIGNATVANTIQANASYQYTPQGTNATLTFTDAGQTPQAAKPISYQVLVDGRKITDGEGKTDAAGKLAISFNTAKQNGGTSYRLGQIISKIIIAKDTITKQVTFNPASAQTDVQFFPEGGNLIAGLNAVIAFKVIGPDGLGVNISGEVLDEANNKVAQLTTQRLGMGSFVLTAAPGKTYHADVAYPDGSHGTIALPQVQNSGYAINVTAAGPNHRVRLTASPDRVADGPGVELVAQQAGKVYYAATANLSTGASIVSLPDDRFPSGIVQFTLFSSTGEPLAERLVFIKNDKDLLKMDIASVKNVFAPHEDTKIGLHIQDQAGKPVVGSFSASVISEDKLALNGDNQGSILSNILLTSDLKGYIEQPGYYFTNNNDQVNNDLDVLMLTQGYRRFEWKPLLTGTIPAIAYQPEKGLSVTGRVFAKGNPAAGAPVTLFATQGGPLMLDTVTDKDGKFTFNELAFGDSVKFTIQARTAKGGKDVDIVLDRPTPAYIPGPKINGAMLIAGLVTTPAYTEYLKASHNKYEGDIKTNGIKLKMVTIKAKKIEPQLNSVNLNGAGRANKVLMGDSIIKGRGYSNVLEALYGRVPGVIIKKRSMIDFAAYSMRKPGGGPMLTMVNGAITDLSNVNPNDVQSIEVLTSVAYTAIYGGDGANGVILVNLKNGSENLGSSIAQKAPGVITYSPKGLYVAREFYKPVYNANAATTQPDKRTTISWENNLITDKDGNTSFSYFNAATKGNYRIVVEGIDNDGHLGRQVYRYKVE